MVCSIPSHAVALPSVRCPGIRWRIFPFVAFLTLAAVLVSSAGFYVAAQSSVPGDVDGSGAVTAVDVQQVIRCALGFGTNAACDLDGVNGVNSQDVQLVVNAALGLPIDDQVKPKRYTYTVVQTYPHDPAAFTQGLVYTDGVLYEGTGLYGQSSLRETDLITGAVTRQKNLAANYFGEGVTVMNGRIYQLTWRARKGFIYDQATFESTGDFSYTGEGWGLTDNGTELIMSDGTADIRFLHPETFAEIRRITAKESGAPVTRLNELEYIDGEIYANVWQTERVVRIDPETGRVTATIDLTGLRALAREGGHSVDVLNGIAYDQSNDRLYVTGKFWPKLFHIELVPVE